MTCSDVRTKLSAVLDGAAEEAVRDAVADHVRECEGCRSELVDLAAVDAAVLRALRSGDAAPVGYFERLWQRLEPQLGAEADKVAGETEAPARPRRRRPWWALGGVAAAAATLVVLWLGRTGHEERVQPPPTSGPPAPPSGVGAMQNPVMPATPPAENSAPNAARPAPRPAPLPAGFEQGMRGIERPITACFDLHSIAGTVVVKMTVDPDGRVVAAEAEGGEGEGAKCVVREAWKAKFPPFQGARTTFRYPFSR